MVFQSSFGLNDVNKKLEQIMKSLRLDEVDIPPPPVIIPLGPVSVSTTFATSSRLLSKPLPGSFPVDEPLQVDPEAELTENHDPAETLSDALSFKSTEVQRGTNTPIPELQPLDDSEETLVDTPPGSSKQTTFSDRETLPALPAAAVEPYFTDPKPRRSKYPNYHAFRSRKAPCPAAVNETSDYAAFLKQAEDAKSVGGETVWSVQTVYTEVSDDTPDSDNWSFYMEKAETLQEMEEDIENFGIPSKLSYSSTRARQPLRDITAHFCVPFDDQERPLGRDYNHNKIPCSSDPAAAVQKALHQQSQRRQEKVAREIDMSPFGDDTRSRGDIFKRGVPWGFHGRDYCPPALKEHFLEETLRGMRVTRRGVMERGGILERVKFWGKWLVLKFVRLCDHTYIVLVL